MTNRKGIEVPSCMFPISLEEIVKTLLILKEKDMDLTHSITYIINRVGKPKPQRIECRKLQLKVS